MTKPSCTSEPREVCQPVQRNVCRQVPSTQCQQVPQQTCQTVEREVCQDSPQTQCQQVPREQCSSVPTQQCSTVPRQVCETIPKQNCRQEVNINIAMIIQEISNNNCPASPGVFSSAGNTKLSTCGETSDQGRVLCSPVPAVQVITRIISLN